MKLVVVLIATAAVLVASEPWTKNSQTWTAADDDRILTSSPWAQEAKASFGEDDLRENPPPPGPLPGAAEAGMAGPRGATDGRWDGGVGRMPRGTVPTLPVLIRWDTALPVREASAQLSRTSPGSTGGTAITTEEAAKYYVITVIGLVPAGRYRDGGELNNTSRSDDTIDARDPEELLEGLMSATRLRRRGRPALVPENVRLDGKTGTVRIFFPRVDPIGPAEKEIAFTTRFGSLTVQRVFRPRDMIYKGRLEL